LLRTSYCKKKRRVPISIK